MKTIQALRDLLDNARADRMRPVPFQGGLARHGKHAAGHKGQTYKKRNGGTKRRQTQPHPSSVASQSEQWDAA